MSSSLSYKKSGVDYEILDHVKILAQQSSKQTANNLPSGLSELPESRGESAYVVDLGDKYMTIVEEGLGTKNLIADQMYQLSGKSYYDQIAQDTVGTIVNDLITVGARPLTIVAYWAVGSSDWFSDRQRVQDLITGWTNACNGAGVTWGGGETPTLSGIVNESTIDLAGSCVGLIDPKNRLTLGKKLVAGDRIVVFESSGIHANGLTLARKLADKLSNGFNTKIGDGRAYGEALLDPTILYPKLVQNIFEAGVNIHYMAHITGHGWRKLMRLDRDFTYRITKVPPVPDILSFIVNKAGLDHEEAYSTFNMGAGYAVFIPEKFVNQVVGIALKHNVKAHDIGVVEEGSRQVIIEPKNVIFGKKSLQVRV